jgi:divalent metal cation (Fe/Co/Zn/Cd) transporter
MHIGPEDVLVTIDLEFDPGKSAEDLMEAVDHIQCSIRERFPAVKYVYIDPEFARRERRRGASALARAS